MSDFHFSHEEINTGGTKYPTKVHLRAHHPDGSDAGSMHYFPPKRKGSPVTVGTLPHGDDRARGAGSALLDEMERRHPGSRVVYMDELHEKNKPKPGDPNFNPNRDYGLPTDWDTHFPALPDTIHRGMGVRLDKYDAKDIHDPNMAAEDQAKTLRRAIETGGPGGMHWSADESKSHQFAHRNVTDPRTDIPVVLHARTPTRKDIETRPDVLRNKGVWPHDHSAGDVEVPIRKRRPVTITGMSWLPDAEHPEADENGWLHHTFDEPLIHNASRGFTPRIPGGTIGEDTNRGRGTGDATGRRTAGRGKPRSNGSPRGSGPGDSAAGTGGVGGEAGELGAGQEGPRSVEFHPGAAKDLSKLDKPVQKQIGAVIDQLANGDEGLQTHALNGRLKGWNATKASRGHRITHRMTDEGNIHIGHIGLHNYDEAIRRLTRKAMHDELDRAEHRDGHVLLHRGVGEHDGKTWDGKPYANAEDWHRDAQEDRPGYGSWWGADESMAKFYGDGGHSGIVVSAWFPKHVIQDSDSYSGVTIPEGTKGHVHRVQIKNGRGENDWKDLPHTPGMRITASEEDDYRMQHRPPDETGIPIHDLASGVPEDVYDKPHWYSDMSEPSNRVAHDVIRRVRGKPEAKVRIYRALPAEHAGKGFRQGDWVTTSKEYARGHGKQFNKDSKHDWPIISTVVPAKHLHTDADDFREWGYNGPHKPNVSVAFKGGYHQEISQREDGTIAPVQRRAPRDPGAEMWGHAVVKMSPEDYHKAVTTFEPRATAEHVLKHVGDVKWLPKGAQGYHGEAIEDPADSWWAERGNQSALNAHHQPGGHEPGSAPLLGVTLHTKNGKTVDRVGLHPHLDYGDQPMGFDNGYSIFSAGRAIKHPSLGQGKTSRALPTDRIFGPTYGLDHRLFEGEHLKDEVRSAILERLDKILRVDAQLVGSGWQDYIEVYLGGSEASEWTSPTLEGNNDFDTLLGIDYDKLRGHDGRGKSAEWIDKTDSEIDDVFNDVLRTFFNDEDWLAPFGGVYHLTGYVNGDAYDIRDIKPYAAYDLTKDAWAVKPPHLPGWSPQSFPQGPALWKQCEAIADEIEAILELPEPYRTQQGASLYDHLHSDRHRAFGPNGEGWYDNGNVIEKYLDQLGLWAKLLHLKKNAEHETFDDGERPMLEALAVRLYHGTSAENAAQIEREGLTSPVYDETHNTLSESRSQALELARRRGRQDPTVVAFDVPEHAVDEHLHPPYEYWGGSGVANTYALRKPLPPHFVATAKTASSDGDDWVNCDQGHEHWGTNGAAGMLIRRKGDDGRNWYLLQKRAPWVDHGNTWSIPGGAIGSDETPEEAAHRETHEEMGELPELVHSHTVADDHGGWKYHTVVADAPHEFHPDGGDDDEHAGHGWFTHDELSDLPLHPGFKKTWDRVRTSHPGNVKQAMSEEEAGHDRAKRYVQWQLDRPHDDMEEEDIAPDWMHSSLYQRHNDFDKEWGKATADTKRNFRHHVNALSRKRLIIGTNHVHEILDSGRMKTVGEVGAEHRHWGESYMDDRHAYEHHIMGIDDDLPAHQRPIYGSLHDDPAKNHYGEVQFELKPHVRDRTTVTMGDSLNHILRNYPINHAHRLDHDQTKAMTDPSEIDKLGSDPEPISYMEAQVHGGVKLNDIARLHVHGDIHNDGELSDEHKAMAEHARAKGLQVIHHRPDPFEGLSPKHRETLMRMKGKKTMRLDLGRGAYADYEHGMGSRDEITIVRPDGVIKTTWGSLVAQSNGEILRQIPKDEGEPKTAATRTVPSNGGQGDISDSMMIAIVPPATVAEGLALDDEAGLRVEELHITLLYLGKAKSYTDKQLMQLPVLVQQWAKTQQPLPARTQGAGTFVNEGEHVMWASVDIPGGGRMHDTLADFLRGHGIEVKEDHGFIPHITLKYDKYHVRFLPKIHPESWTVDEIWFCRAGEWVSYPLGR